VGTNTLRNVDGSRLTTWQCLSFLTDQPKDYRYLGFWFDYDASCMFRDLPIEALRKLALVGSTLGSTHAIVWVADPSTGVVYGLRHIPHKFLTIIRVGESVLDAHGQPQRNPRGQIRRVKGSGRRITVYDVFGYFQASFLAAITTWNIGTEADRRLIAEAKAARSEFVLPLPESVIEYNVLECRLLADLMTKLDAAADCRGLALRKYCGAGTLAELLMDKNGVAEHREYADRPHPLRDAIDRAFFGGRFETAVVGVVPEMHNIDIASAYPAAMVSLPCLRHGRWRHLGKVTRRQIATLPPSTILRVRWDIAWSGITSFGPFPYRCRDGSLLYPSTGSGWYWAEEVLAAMDCFGADCFQVEEAWKFIPGCTHQPFDWVVNVYQERVKLGKNAEGIVLKLALNSVYGKLAQTVGRAQFAEFVWAGMITARTRARMLEVIGSGNDHVLMLAADGGYLDCAPQCIGIPTSEEPSLGEWEYKPTNNVHHNPLIVQPGLWLAESVDEHQVGASKPQRSPKRSSRVRGFGEAALAATNARERILEAYRSDGLNARICIGPEHVIPGARIPMAFVGYRSAIHRNKMEELATWQPFDKTISLDPRPKRTPLPRRDGEDFIRTQPAMNVGKLTHLGVNAMLELSAPYKRLRHKDQERDIYHEQPEHDTTLERFLGAED
jgi:hypothetical protein